MKLREYANSENIFDLLIICFLITFNLFFSIFVWMSSDLSPNQAIGFISLIFIFLEIYRIRRRTKMFVKTRKSAR